MANLNKRHFVDLFKACRERSGFSQAELADEAGCSRSTIARMESRSEDYIAKTETFEKIKRALDKHNSPSQINELVLIRDSVKSTEAAEKTTQTGLIVNRITNELNRWPAGSVEGKGFVKEMETSISLWALYYMARIDLENGEPDRAARYLQEVKGKSGNRNLLKTLALKDLAICGRSLGEDMKIVRGLLDEAVTIAEAYPEEIEHRLIGDIWTTIGDIHRRNGEFDEAFKAYRTASEKFGEINIEDINTRLSALARVDIKKAGVLLYRGEAEQAESELRSCLRSLKTISDKKGLRKAEQHLAWAWALLGYYDEALRLHESHLQNYQVESQKDYLELAKSQCYFGEILRLCRKYQEAATYFRKSQKSLRDYAETILEEKESLIKGPIHVGLGQVLTSLGDFAGAEETLQKSERINKNAPFFLARTNSAFGKLSIKMGKYQVADSRLKIAEEMFEDLHNNYYIVDILINKSHLELAKNENMELARELATDAFTYSQAHSGFDVHYIRANLMLAKLDLLTGTKSDPNARLSDCLTRCIMGLENTYLMAYVINEMRTLSKIIKPNQYDQVNAFIKSELDRLEDEGKPEFVSFLRKQRLIIEQGGVSAN